MTLPPNNQTETSAVADSMMPTAGFPRERIFHEIQRRGGKGATNDELCVALNLAIQTICPRANELFLEGLIRKSGIKRMTRQDRQAEAWILGSDSKPLSVEPKLVKIKTWRVSGAAKKIGIYFTEEAACAANSMACGGWGDVKEEIVLAIRA